MYSTINLDNVSTSSAGTSIYNEYELKYKDLLEQQRNAQKFNQSCPSCGYCPHCGRGGHQTYPSYPHNPWITYTSGGINDPNQFYK